MTNRLIEIQKAFPSVTPTEFVKLAEASSVGKYKYTRWLFNIYTKTYMPITECPKVQEYLKMFEKYNINGKAIKTDINKFSTLSELYDFIDKLMPKVDPNKIADIIPNRDKVKESCAFHTCDKFIAYIPSTYLQMRALGSRTKWKTASDEDVFNFYCAMGPIVVLEYLTGDCDIYQLHFQTSSILNNHGIRIYASNLFDPNCPDMKELFEKLDSFQIMDLVLKTNAETPSVMFLEPAPIFKELCKMYRINSKYISFLRKYVKNVVELNGSINIAAFNLKMDHVEHIKGDLYTDGYKHNFPKLKTVDGTIFVGALCWKSLVDADDLCDRYNFLFPVLEIGGDVVLSGKVKLTSRE